MAEQESELALRCLVDLQRRHKLEHQQIPQWSGMQPVTPEKLTVSPEKLGLERQADPQRRLELRWLTSLQQRLKLERWQLPQRGQELRQFEQQLDQTEPKQE
ncbi:hypothetical protein XENOCAPTIV_014798 [Xenoophorus captivus]|uniref:Uncharacterized protein n=1 Tax=Xenoophorus captivus TaxID=1517983 RepID=A0ABV0QIC7_9TELE